MTITEIGTLLRDTIIKSGYYCMPMLIWSDSCSFWIENHKTGVYINIWCDKIRIVDVDGSEFIDINFCDPGLISKLLSRLHQSIQT